MAKLIGAAIAITLIASGTAYADHEVDIQGLGTGTVATATPTGLVVGTVATATPSDTPTLTPTATVTVTNTPLPEMRTVVPLISEDGCAVPSRRRSFAWWLLAVPLGVAPARRWNARWRARRNE